MGLGDLWDWDFTRGGNGGTERRGCYCELKICMLILFFINTSENYLFGRNILHKHSPDAFLALCPHRKFTI